MATLNLTDEQVIELIEQLPPTQKLKVLITLATDAHTHQEEQTARSEARLRQLAAERGRNWDKMSDEERLFLVDDLIHEDREAPR